MPTPFSVGFLAIASLDLLPIVGRGVFIGGSGDHHQTQVHGHINLGEHSCLPPDLSGYPAIGGSGSSQGALMCVPDRRAHPGRRAYRLVNERLAEATIGLVLLIRENLMLASRLALTLNLYRRA